jgi:DNA adenine methylase
MRYKKTTNRRYDRLKPAPVPFQYFGGKSSLRSKIVSVMPPHSVYVEPFAGAASVLLGKPQSEREVLNDKNPQIMKIHRSLKQRAQTWLMSPSRRKWERIRRKSPSERNAEEEAYLIEHSFNGLGQNYTSHGKKGNFDTSRIHDRLKSVVMENGDFAACMRRWDSERTLHYLDPPYVVGGFRYEEHDMTPERVAEVAGKMRGKVIVSYDDDKAVRDAFPKTKFRIRKVTHRYGAQHGSEKVHELLITNFDPEKERAKTKEP